MLTSPLLNRRARIDFFAQKLEGSGREDRLDGQAKELTDPKGQFQAGIVLTALQVANGLIIDADGVGQRQARHAALSPQDSQAVIDLRFRHAHLFLLLATKCVFPLLIYSIYTT